jgi:transcriptional regulator with XRE-family HTH domain
MLIILPSDIIVNTFFPLSVIFFFTRKRRRDILISEGDIMYSFAPILERIKAVKKESGMTNEELSRASGIPRGTLNKILSGGTTEPKLPALMAIAAALDTSVDYLVYGRIPTISAELSQAEYGVIKAYRELNEEGQELVFDYVDTLVQSGKYIKNSPSCVVSEEA